MQTLLSKITLVLVSTLQITGFTTAAIFMFVEIWGPFNKTLSMLLATAACITILTFIMSELALAGAKYLSVYHNDIVANLDEVVIAKKISLVIVCLPCVLTCFEYTFLTDIKNTFGYHAVRYDFDSIPNIDRELSVSALAGIFLLVVGIFLFRFELDYYQRGEQEGLIYNLRKCFGVNDNDCDDLDGYRISVVRTLVAILAVFGFFLLFAKLNSILTLGIIYATHHAIAPFLVVWNHPSMRLLLKSRLKIVVSRAAIYELNV